MKVQQSDKPLVLVTGCSGLIGSRLVESLLGAYSVVGLDLEPPAWAREDARWLRCDLTDDQNVAEALARIRATYGERIASVFHLAAYYDFSGEPSPLYRELTVEGTRRLIEQLRYFTVEQFCFSSTLLVMESSDDDQRITEDSPVDAEWDYPASKLAAEKVIAARHGDIPAVILRIAGVYDELCHSLPIAQHIRRIHEKQLEGYFFPGDKQHGQAFVHLEDLAGCFQQAITRRKELGPYETFLIGEEDVMSYDELQEQLGKLIHGWKWPTIRIPKAVAKVGAWAQEKMVFDEADEPFIKPWMIDLADQNYPVNIHQAREKLGWEPTHSLRKTLPAMIESLRRDPRRWYEINHLPLPNELMEKKASAP